MSSEKIYRQAFELGENKNFQNLIFIDSYQGRKIVLLGYISK